MLIVCTYMNENETHKFKLISDGHYRAFPSWNHPQWQWPLSVGSGQAGSTEGEKSLCGSADWLSIRILQGLPHLFTEYTL